ncbi:hypothetical protein BDA96_07G053500 [Sorghum bicolor]|uniref:Uncharacterized protein n=1 Tax=Sorghum bicolor TaxID=4558 RepID=A0A921U8F1_SORBI|nr:hypothetical protein BDA96_07G053500 [Sorghum bicolor]
MHAAFSLLLHILRPGRSCSDAPGPNASSRLIRPRLVQVIARLIIGGVCGRLH